MVGCRSNSSFRPELLLVVVPMIGIGILDIDRTREETSNKRVSESKSGLEGSEFGTWNQDRDATLMESLSWACLVNPDGKRTSSPRKEWR